MSSEKTALVVNAAYACPHLMGFAAQQPTMRPGTVASISYGFDSLQSFSDRQLFSPPVYAGEIAMPEGVDYEYRAQPDREMDIGSLAAFLPRSKVETDPTWKQLIPYAVVMQDTKICCYRRPAKNAESRLAGLRSLGFGGHTEPADFETLLLSYKLGNGGIQAKDVIDLAMAREVSEELGINLNDHEHYSARFLGWLNHDDTPVGSVHLGLVYLVRVNSATIFQPQNDEIEGLELLSIDDAYAKIDEFEVWSQFVLRYLKHSNL